MRHLPAAAVVVACLAAGCASATQPATTASVGAAGETVVVVVRHAERADEPGARLEDPDLSAIGHDRAEMLRAALADAEIAAIYTTDRRRTAQTAGPVARHFGIQIRDRAIEARDGGGYGAELLARLRTEHRGQTVLVVGHSNTVPGIVGALSGYDVQEMDDAEFDRVYIVVLADGAPARLFRTRFGAATPIPLP